MNNQWLFSRIQFTLPLGSQVVFMTTCIYLGRSFKHKDLSGLDLSSKLLIAANFSHCSFHGTIFLGADTRDADFSHADLSDAVFLSQGQVNAAKGNLNTKLPKHLDYPVTWK